MPSFARSMLLLPVLAVLAVPVHADDAAPAAPAAPPAKKKIDNPEYTQWAAFKVGAFVELTMESTQMGTTSTVKMSHKLLELTPEKAVVETTMVTQAAGQEFSMPASKRDVPKTLEVPDVKPPEVKPDQAPKVTVGEETVEVAGKQVACKTSEATYETQGIKTWSKSWTTKDIPGGLAKQESKSEGKVGGTDIAGTSKTTVTKFGTGS